MTKKARSLSVAEPAIEALVNLARDHGDTLRSFKDAFRERSRDQSLVEAGPRGIGLFRVFTGLLRRIPTSRTLDQPLPNGQFDDQGFMEDIKRALRSVAKRDPRAFELLSEHQRKSQKNLPEVFAALFNQYAENRKVIPY